MSSAQQNEILTQHASFKLETDEDATALYNFLRTHWRQAVLVGDPLVVMVCTASEKRTPEQNKRYQKGLREIAASGWENGEQHPPEWWNDKFKEMFLETHDGAGEPLSTSDLSAGEFSDFLEQVEQYAADVLGVTLNIPDTRPSR